jgi:T-complex protein 1 subunit beta
MVIEHADFEGIERLAVATGSEIISTFDQTHRKESVLGHADLIEEIMIGEDKFIKFNGCKSNKSCTIVLRGSSKHILDEAERSFHDAICVLVNTVKNNRVLLGGGNSEMRMAMAVDKLAKSVKGKTAMAIEAYAKALRQLPMILADNGGFDSAELVQDLRVDLEQGQETMGLNLFQGQVECMQTMGVTESFRAKEQALMSASEAAEMILRVDDIIKCAPRERQQKGCA